MKEGLERKIKEYMEERKLSERLDIKKEYSVRFLAQGEYNKNYIVYDGCKKFVFRVNTASQLGLENQIEYEYGALKSLEQSGVTPRALYVDGDKRQIEYGILIMEFLEGRPLLYDRDLEKAASIFGNIHSIDTERIKDRFIVETDILTERVTESKLWLKDYLNSPMVDRELKKFFMEFLEWAERNTYREEYFEMDSWQVVNNTEVNSHNFIIGKEKSYLIDWEKPVISDPCQDITQFLAETTTLWKSDYILGKEEREIFYDTYIKSLSIPDKDIKERVHIYTPYLYLRALSWCAYAWLEYQNPQKEIRNMDTLKKIEDYLNIDFMKKLLVQFI